MFADVQEASMRSARLWTFSISVAMIAMMPGSGQTQTLGEATSEAPAPLERWELSFGTRIGAPIGRLQVGESFNGSSTPGTRLSLGTLGIHVSETIEAGAAYHFTPDDALRVSALYTFLRGDSTPGQSVVYNGLEFKPGPLDANADFWRVDLAYERVLARSTADELVGSLGLAYVFFNPTLTSPGQKSGENSEDFYLQELPIPIAGVRWSHVLGDHWLLRLGVSGGGLPRVDSLRKEGGTVYLQQSHADADAGLVYRWRGGAELEIGYHFTYFFQHEKSHEDNNLFELIDNGVRARFSVRF
ncbi:MAG: hypothetical protein DMD87_20400 [Candidatus Rokuibacteriota bacterium]|nr:MAG: hypothetical protein DMD87_20400 [Candidatus Rokubacteria bacterium]